MVDVFIGVSSNIEPMANILAAVSKLREHVHIVAISTFYLTAPIGSTVAPPFYNGMLRIQTTLDHRELKTSVLLPIEDAMGRIRSHDKYAPRPIDLDIIVYGDSMITEPGVIIPDPDLFERAFLAHTLAEIAGDMILPGTNQSATQIAAASSKNDMTPLPDFTSMLRKEIL